MDLLDQQKIEQEVGKVIYGLVKRGTGDFKAWRNTLSSEAEYELKPN